MQQTIREMTKHLMELGDEDWGRYAFRHEPLERKLSEAQKETYTRLAMESRIVAMSFCEPRS